MNSRQIKLLKILFFNKDYEPVGDIADKLNISRRTVFNDLKVIEMFLSTNKIPFIRKPGKGIKVKINEQDTNKIQELMEKMTNSLKVTEVESRFFEIIENILDGKKVTYDLLSESYYINQSSVAQIFEKIKIFFSDKAGCMFHSNIHGSYITGFESQIQFSYSKLIFEKSKNITKLYDAMDNYILFLKQIMGEREVNSCIKLLGSILQDLKSQYNMLYYKELITKLIVMVHRIQKSHHIEDNFMNSTLVLQLESYPAVKEYLTIIEKDLNILFTEEDIFFINHLFIGYGINVVGKSQVYQPQVKDIVQELIIRMGDVTSIDFSRDEILYRQLVSHVGPMLYRVKRRIDFKNPMLEIIKKDYAIIFHLVALVVSDLRMSTGLAIPDDEIAFLTIHFQVSVEKNHMTKKVLIICLNGIASSQLLALKIRRYLPPLDIMEISSLEEVEKIDLAKVDFIISTVKIEIDSIPVFYVSPFISEEELLQIKRYYSKFLIQSTEKASTLLEPINVKKDFLKRANLYKRSEFMTKEEVLSFLSIESKRLDITTNNIFENLMYREQISPTSFINGVAVPHPSPKLVKKTQILIIRNIRGIDWGGEKVNLIFLLCIKEQDINEAKNILASIIRLANSKENIKLLMETDSISSFISSINSNDC